MAQRNAAIERLMEVIEQLEVIEHWCGLPIAINEDIKTVRDLLQRITKDVQENGK